ncbi:glycoside hydrolase family 5 protein [Phanerochaete carnosa HHB-10118-sp]|uniref:Glycoside hydrolase family 5 protein n=1 Tax=Phanerochaete carnosa (strain HHB-10118-sp) TaxID=650164 RepID=K5X001_PHACS|nr:glycoside hydrolase family 5 protein [Phanerochaete carnosa HHB-10118-sp]EKM56102.1 glycoside hydrolase family 5 protein [Phanerochaete carnosa HHB-10118-sp]
MPKVPSLSPTTGQPTPPYYIHTTDTHFVDNAGRSLLLRGINLSGSSKAPYGKQSQVLGGLWESGEDGSESFVNRPLNLDDGSADVHLSRLKGWGFNMLRYVVTWESLEHAGPGQYDHEFMDYVVRVLRKCKEYDFRVYLDPHQDIWSRFSGGSGAPFWTLPACGIDPRNFTATQAAIIHCEYPTPAEPDPAKFPAMTWSTNYGRFAAQTLFTLFFAGRDFAPKCVIDGVNIQDYLQSHYIAAMGELADRVRDAGDLLDECVIGWDSMNEPYEGLCGYPDLDVYPTEQTSTLKKGSFPTPAQSMRLGMGQKQTVDSWAFGTFGPKRDGTVTIDPHGYKMWAEPETEPGGVHPKWGWRRDPGWSLGICIWAQHGVWDVESGYVVVPDYFKAPPSDLDHEVVFLEDYWRPHWQAFAGRMRKSHPEAILFVAPPVFAPPPPISEQDLKGRCCFSTHYYDGLTLINRHWNWFNADALGLLRGKYKSPVQAVKLGERAIRQSLQEQLGVLKDDCKILGSYPTIIGEIGVPFDMDKKRSYGWTDDGKYRGDYTNQQKALDASLNAADGPNVLNYTIWTYCPDNSHMWGDGWNLEDLSVWSVDDLRVKEQYQMQTAESSSAQLLSSVPPPAIGRAPVSDESTLTLTTLVPKDEMKQRIINTLEPWENAYDFLTDGARAVKAFCRPYPRAVVGVPADIEFDVKKAAFKLTVRVRPEDLPRPEALVAPRSSGDSSTLASNGPEKDEALATEIYVPLVHYASDRVIARYNGEQSVDDTPEGDSCPSSPVASDPGSRTPSISDLSASWKSAAADSGTPLALEVEVSDGRWSVDGQLLKWWYPVPSPSEGERTCTITITRIGGAIKLAGESSGTCSIWKLLANCCPFM